MHKLVVNGCSFSRGDLMNEYLYYETKDEKYISDGWVDWGLDKRFSYLISNHFDWEEINISQGGASNENIFRTTYDWVNDRPTNYIKDCTFIIGLTNEWRRDLYSIRLYETNTGDEKNSGYFCSDEMYQNYEIIAAKFGCGAEEFKQYRDFELKYIYRLDELEKKTIRNCNLLNSFIESKGGRVIFFNAMRESKLIDERLNWFKFADFEYNWTDYMRSRSKLYKNDGPYHPPQKEHKKISELLCKYIEENYVK